MISSPLSSLLSLLETTIFFILDILDRPIAFLSSLVSHLLLFLFYFWDIFISSSLELFHSSSPRALLYSWNIHSQSILLMHDRESDSSLLHDTYWGGSQRHTSSGLGPCSTSQASLRSSFFLPEKNIFSLWTDLLGSPRRGQLPPQKSSPGSKRVTEKIYVLQTGCTRLCRELVLIVWWHTRVLSLF